jgi:hypothetical protein
MRLQSTLGDLVFGRCRSTNMCDYCAKLAAVENAEVLAQDAMTNTPPALWTVLTTRSSIASMSEYDVARKAVRRAVRRRWPDAQAATLIEFTTGLGKRAEGRRRPHWNDMWKGIPVDQVDELNAITADAWCQRIDAKPAGQYAGSIHETGGLMRYLALHFQKESQQPPKGWRSHRFTTTRGYLAEPMEQARERAREALRLRRELWKLNREMVTDQWGEEIPLASLLDPREIDDMAQRAAYEKSELGWQLVRLVDVPNGFTEDGDPTGFTVTPVPVSH